MSSGFHLSTAWFGGSFNPPHLGHIEAVRGLLRNPGVKQVKVVPSYGTPLKETALPFSERLAMARIAFDGLAEVDDIEGRHRIEFTWQLLEILRGTGQPVAFVIGSDQLESLPRWSRFPEILSACDWIVLARKPGGLDRAERAAHSLVAGGALKRSENPELFLTPDGKSRLFVCETDAPEISSTQLREHFSRGNTSSPPAHLPVGVRDYIERNHLYGT
jgi:nicotinate-nucleotide adenylyltransferase